MNDLLKMGWIGGLVICAGAFSACGEDSDPDTGVAGMVAPPAIVPAVPPVAPPAVPPVAPPAVPPVAPPAVPPVAPPAVPPALPPATFADVVGVYNGSCAFMSCHDSDAPQAGLDLVTDPYNATVNVMALGAPALTLVVPGDPDASYLYQKVTQDMPAVGGRMPPGGGELSAERIEILRSWIAAGAQM